MNKMLTEMHSCVSEASFNNSQLNNHSTNNTMQRALKSLFMALATKIPGDKTLI